MCVHTHSHLLFAYFLRQAYPRYLVTYDSNPGGTSAGDRSSSAQSALKGIGCDATLVKDGKPTAPPQLTDWDFDTPVTESGDGGVIEVAAFLSGDQSSHQNWEWEDGSSGSGQWNKYDAASCAKLEAALHGASGSASSKVITLVFAQYGTYDVDVIAMTQKKQDTGYARSVRRTGDPPSVFGGAVATAGVRPQVGDSVMLAPHVTVASIARYNARAARHLGPGDRGKLVTDDGSSLPFKVESEDGRTCWFTADMIVPYVAAVAKRVRIGRSVCSHCASSCTQQLPATLSFFFRRHLRRKLAARPLAMMCSSPQAMLRSATRQMDRSPLGMSES